MMFFCSFTFCMTSFCRILLYPFPIPLNQSCLLSLRKCTYARFLLLIRWLLPVQNAKICAGSMSGLLSSAPALPVKMKSLTLIFKYMIQHGVYTPCCLFLKRIIIFPFQAFGFFVFSHLLMLFFCFPDVLIFICFLLPLTFVFPFVLLFLDFLFVFILIPLTSPCFCSATAA